MLFLVTKYRCTGKRKISNIKTTNNKQGGKEMKRKLVSVLLSVSLVAAMVMGCSNGDGGQEI